MERPCNRDGQDGDGGRPPQRHGDTCLRACDRSHRQAEDGGRRTAFTAKAPRTPRQANGVHHRLCHRGHRERPTAPLVHVHGRLSDATTSGCKLTVDVSACGFGGHLSAARQANRSACSCPQTIGGRDDLRLQVDCRRFCVRLRGTRTDCGTPQSEHVPRWLGTGSDKENARRPFGRRAS